GLVLVMSRRSGPFSWTRSTPSTACVSAAVNLRFDCDAPADKPNRRSRRKERAQFPLRPRQSHRHRVSDAFVRFRHTPIDFKQKLYRQLDELLPPDVIIASSSSGLTMSEIQSGAASHPERCVIAHPFNPPHLIPLVEIVGGAKTSEATIRRAAEFYT